MTGLRVPYALAVYDDREIDAVVNVLKSHKSMMGEQTKKFEERVAEYFGKKHGIMVNSGSSANLLAFESLKFSPEAEIITPSVTFSTTLAPILQKGLTPIFTDVEIGKYTIDIDQIEKAITK